MNVRMVMSSAVLVAFAAGCGGGSHAAGALPQSPSQPNGNQHATATLTVTIPQPPSAAQAKRPAYVSSGTESLTIFQGSTTLGTFNTTPASPGCAATANGTACTFSIAPAAGANQVFTVTAYQYQNAGGAVLSTGSITETVAANSNTNIAITMGGVPATLAVIPPQIPAATPTSAPLTVEALDASGATIIGAAAYQSPITVSVASNGGIVQLAVDGGSPASSIQMTKPTDTASVVYNGQTLGFAALTASVSVGGSNLTSAADFAPTPTIVATHGAVVPTTTYTNFFNDLSGPDPVTHSFYSYPESATACQYGIAQISATASFSVYGMGTFDGCQQPNSGALVDGPSGLEWFTLNEGSSYVGVQYGSFDPIAHTISEYVVPGTLAAGNCYSQGYPIAQTTSPAGLYVQYYCYPSGQYTQYLTGVDLSGNAIGSLSPWTYDTPVGAGANLFFAVDSDYLMGEATASGSVGSYALTESSSNLPFTLPSYSSPTAASDGSLWDAESCNFIHVVPGSPFSSSTVQYFAVPGCAESQSAGATRRQSVVRRDGGGPGGIDMYGPVVTAPDGSRWALSEDGSLVGMSPNPAPGNVSFTTAFIPTIVVAGKAYPLSIYCMGIAADGNLLIIGEEPSGVGFYTAEIAY